MQGGYKLKTVDVHNRCSDFNSYRASRVKSMFNCDSGCDFKITAQIPTDEEDWKIGVIVGPSGSGKTSIGKKVWDDVPIHNMDDGWDNSKPIIDCIAKDGLFNDVTGSLAAVGLGDVPSWLRPYGVLSNGEKFRAALARIIAEKPERVIIDEFTSVVDRQIAKVGAAAFSKSWKRTGGKAILLSCHYDILDWLEPDWVFDTRTGELSRRLLRRPEIQLEIFKTDSRYWRIFAPHHYLKIPLPVAAKYYVGVVDGELVAHIAACPALQSNAMRLTRLVVMPEWQGVGVGLRFLDSVADLQFTPSNHLYKRVDKVRIGTSHPGLVAALSRSPRWRHSSQSLVGAKQGGVSFGGHFRATHTFARGK